MTDLDRGWALHGGYMAGMLLSRLAARVLLGPDSKPESEGKRLGWLWADAHEAADRGVSCSDVRFILELALRKARP